MVKKDPGAPFIWIAYGSLILGLVLTFYFPRRVWGRLADGRLELAMLADRYVDAEREFGGLLTSSRPDSVTVPNVECNPRRVGGRG